MLIPFIKTQSHQTKSQKPLESAIKPLFLFYDFHQLEPQEEFFSIVTIKIKMKKEIKKRFYRDFFCWNPHRQEDRCKHQRCLYSISNSRFIGFQILQMLAFWIFLSFK